MPLPMKRRTDEFKQEQSLYVPETQEQPQQQEGSFLSRTIGNIPGSAMNLVGGLGNVIAHPIKTAQALGGIAGGAVDKLLPGEQGGEKNFDALVDFYKERYGSVDKLLQTIEKDPVGFAADASAILGGGGALLKGAGTVSKISALSKVGTVVSKAGQVTNPISAVTGAVSLASKSFPVVARALEKSNLRLTPVQKADLGKRLDDLADYSAKRGIVGNPTSRFEKANAMIEANENILQNFFSQMSKSSVADKQSVLRSLQSLKGVYKNNRDSLVINKQIDGAINQIKRMGDDAGIPYAALNEFKRSTYKNAYNKAGSKVLDDVEHSIGDAVRTSMEKGLEGLKVNGLPIKSFNADYGKLLELKKLLKTSMGRPELSRISEMILGGLVGTALFPGHGSWIGAALGPTAIGNLPITAVRSGAAAGLSKLGSMELSPFMKQLLETGKLGAIGTERLNGSTQQ